MKYRALSFAGLLLAAAPALELAFQPEEGAVVTKTFTEVTTWEVDSMSQSVNGQSRDEMVPPIGGTFESRIVVNDMYEALGSGRPAKLSRSIAEIGGHMETSISAEGVDENYEIDLESPLQDRKVVFEWNESDESYEVRFADEKGASALTEGLLEDMDLRAFLPGEDASVGDTWEVDAELLRHLLRPGGDLAMVPAYEPEGGFMMMTTEQVLMATLINAAQGCDEVSGDVQVTWRETSEDEALAVLGFEVDVTTSSQLDDTVARIFEAVGHEPEIEGVASAVEWSLEGEGQIEWDLERGHFVSVKFDSTFELVFTRGWTQTTGENEYEIGLEFGLSGTTQIEGEAEAE